MRTRATDHPDSRLRVFVNRYILPYIAVVTSITALVTGAAAYANNKELKDKLQQNCVETRIPLQQYFDQQIQQAEHPDPALVKRFHLNPAELQHAIEARVEPIQQAKETFDPADCGY